jgi:hypothetical protein
MIAGSVRIKNRNKGIAMNKTVLGTSIIFAALNLFAQGTVMLLNRNALGTTHVWGSYQYISLVGFGSNDSPSGTTPYQGYGMTLIGANGTGGLYGAATTFAQLLAANGANAPESSLVPMGQTTTFHTGTSAGILAATTDTLVGITPDSPAATFELVAWDNSSGLYPTWTQASIAWKRGANGAFGKSGAFTVLNIGGSVNTPPYMLIPSFNLIPTPEPAAITLGLLGGAMLMICRRRK